MPRVRLADPSRIRAFNDDVDGAQLALSLSTTPCVDVGIAREYLQRFSAFPDKAFKAFFARKILQLPPVIAAQVFDVSNGLISQAGTSRNVYTAANENNSSSLELGDFIIPNTGSARLQTPMNNQKRAQILKAFVRIAIIKNRGVDVPNFQNRMVVGYMSEREADVLRDGMQAMAGVYANCPEMQEGATSQPTQSAQETGEAQGTEGGEQEFKARVQAAGYTSVVARRLMEEIYNQGLEVQSRVAVGSFRPIRGRFSTTLRRQGGGAVDTQLMPRYRTAFKNVFESFGFPRDKASLDLNPSGYPVLNIRANEAGVRQPASSQSFIYQVTADGPMSSTRQNQEITNLIGAGTDRDTAQRLIEALQTRNFNFIQSMRSGPVLSYRLQYFGTSANMPDSVAIKQLIEGILMLDDSDVTMVERSGDLSGTITFPAQSAAASSQAPQPEGEERERMRQAKALSQEMGYYSQVFNYVDTELSMRGYSLTRLEDSMARRGFEVTYVKNDPSNLAEVHEIRRELVTRASTTTFGQNARERLIAQVNALRIYPQSNGESFRFIFAPLSDNQVRTDFDTSASRELSTGRRTLFNDPILANRVTQWFRANGYEDTYDDFYQAVSDVPTAMITVQDERPEELRITVTTSDRIETHQLPALAMKQVLAGPRGSENQRARYHLIDYTLNGMRTAASWRILAFTGAQSATSTTASPAQRADNDQVEQLAREYDSVAAGPRLRGTFTREQYVQLRLAGYGYNDLRAFDRLFRERNLAVSSVVVKRTPRGGIRQFIQLNTQRGASGVTPRAMRNRNYQDWLARNIRGLVGRSNVQVSVGRNPNQGPYLQMAGFRRGSGRGYFILPSYRLADDTIPVLSNADRQEISRIQSEVTGIPQSGQGTPSRQTSPDFDPQGDPGQAGPTNPTSATAPPTGTRTRNVKLNRTMAIEIEGDMPFAREANMSITEYFKLRMRQWCQENGQPQLKVGSGKEKYTFGGDGSVRGVVPFEVDSRVFVPPNIDPRLTTLPSDFLQRNKFDTDVAMWNEIRTFCESLRYSGVRIHKSAGLHIHISVADYTSEDYERYVYNYASFEPLIDLAMTANSRGPGRAYSTSLVTSGEVTTGSSRGRTIRGGTPEQAARRASGIGREKIRTTTGIGTIEFRHPMSTIDYDDIKNLMLLHFYLITVSKRKKLQRTNFKGLMNILPIEVSTYFYNRIETMDMKKPDYNFFTGGSGLDGALKKSGDTSSGVREANLPREDYT